MFSWFKFWKKKKSLNWLAIEKAVPGDIVYINYAHIENTITCFVENNDPVEGKIFLALHYNKKNNTCESKEVFHYEHTQLRNFRAMNEKNLSDSDQSTEGYLNKELEIAIAKEEYEMAAKLKKALDIIKE